MNASLYWTMQHARDAWQEFRFRAQCWWLRQEIALLDWRLCLRAIPPHSERLHRHPWSIRQGTLCLAPTVRELRCGARLNRSKRRTPALSIAGGDCGAVLLAKAVAKE